MIEQSRIQRAVNSYSVIGKCVADAVALQDDMKLVGVADITTDWRLRMAARKGFRLYVSAREQVAPMRKAGFEVVGALDELMADLGRPHDNLYEVALCADMLKVEGDELFYAYMVDNQPILIPETVDAIRALTGREREAARSIAATDRALDIGAIARALGRG